MASYLKREPLEQIKELFRLGLRLPVSKSKQVGSPAKEYCQGLPKGSGKPDCMVALQERPQRIQREFLQQVLEQMWGVYPQEFQVLVLGQFTNGFWVLRNYVHFANLLNKGMFTIQEVLRLRSLFVPFVEIVRVFLAHRSQEQRDQLLPEFVVEPMKEVVGLYPGQQGGYEKKRVNVGQRNIQFLEAKATWEFDLFLQLQQYVLESNKLDEKKKLRGLRRLEISFHVYEG